MSSIVSPQYHTLLLNLDKITRYFNKTSKNTTEADKIEGTTKAELMGLTIKYAVIVETAPDGRKAGLKVDEERKESDSDCAGLHSLAPACSKEGVCVVPDERPGAQAKSPHCDTDHHNLRKSRDTTVTGQNGSTFGGRLSPQFSFNLFTRTAADSGSVELGSSSRHLDIETLDSSHHH